MSAVTYIEDYDGRPFNQHQHQHHHGHHQQQTPVARVHAGTPVAYDEDGEFHDDYDDFSGNVDVRSHKKLCELCQEMYKCDNSHLLLLIVALLVIVVLLVRKVLSRM